MVDPSALATWANAITVGRLLLSPLMFWVIPDDPAAAGWRSCCGSCCASATPSTATSPGVTARRARAPSSIRSPTRCSCSGAMFTLVGNGVFWVVPVVIIAAREFVISMYRTVVGSKGVSVPASRMAKNKTLAQQLAVGFALLPLTALDATWLWNGLLWIAVVLAVASGWSYLRGSRARPSTSRCASHPDPAAIARSRLARRVERSLARTPRLAASSARSLEDSLGSHSVPRSAPCAVTCSPSAPSSCSARSTTPTRRGSATASPCTASGRSCRSRSATTSGASRPRCGRCSPAPTP